jgi:hypothetical protein
MAQTGRSRSVWKNCTNTKLIKYVFNELKTYE